MPIYEYECEVCGHHHEVMQKMSDDPLVQCPSCGKPGLRKLISAAGFRLSGSGWYETDFKKSGKRNLVEKDSKESGKTSSTKSTDSSKSKKSSSAANNKPAAPSS